MTKTDFGLTFADGVRWTIRALDAEAVATVRDLGKVFRLGPTLGRGRLCSVSGQKQARGGRWADGRGLACRLGPARSWPGEVLRMDRVVTAIAERSLTRGGLLLHGALAVRDGAGFVLAGPSGIGKSTASRRLPAPWESLSDDCVFVARDPDGRYWAHPWPTWSRLRDNGLVASWPVEQAVPLKALLFLRQSASDRAEPVATTPAAALVIESAHLLARLVMFRPNTGGSRAVCTRYLRAARALTAAVPAFNLNVSPAGRFWEEIERAVAMEPRMDREGETDASQKAKAKTGKAKPAEPTTRTRTDASQKAEAKSHKSRPSEPAALTRAVQSGPQKPRRRSVPEPPRHLLSGSPKPKLVRFQVGPRTFLKLVTGRRVVASANDILTEWQVRRRSRRKS